MTGLFTAGSVLTAANLNTAINSSTLNAQTAAGYTLVLTDAGKLVTLSNASAQNLTIPLNSSVAYATGTTIDVLNIGAGTWTLTPTGGVTLTGTTSIPTSARVQLVKTGTDTWYAHASGGGGLTLVTSTSFSAVASVSVNNCFSATYDNYQVIGMLVGSTSMDVQMRLRVGGVDNSTANSYVGQRFYTDASSSTSQAWSSDYHIAGSSDANRSTLSVLAVSPFLSTTTALSSRGGRSNRNEFSDTRHTATSSFDGFSLLASTGDITGTLKIYGYQNT